MCYHNNEVISMARPKKNIEPIVGTVKDPEKQLTVQKSIPLFSLWRSDMSLAEFKILDTYLSRINSHEPERRTVVFTKGELEQLLGVKKINKADLSTRLNGLGRFVDVEHSDNKLHKVALFEEAFGEMDENGLWTVKLTCTAKAMKYIFNIEKLGYLRYKLRCITSLTSRYTYVLFMYLEANRFRKSWVVEVDELRQVLNCDQDESYSAFKVFNDRILKRCQKELLEKTECRFTYEPVKTGRRVTGVRFTLETIADILPEDAGELDGQQQLPWFDEDPDDPLGFLSSACDNEFSREEMQEIFTIISTKSVDQLPIVPGFPDDIAYSRYHYLAQMYARMNVHDKREPIRTRFSYFKTMLKKDGERHE